MVTDTQSIDFERQLGCLETLVSSLEGGELSLEESLKSFEQGITIARECQLALKSAEQRVELLVQQGDNLLGQVFEPDQN